ncbi:hypothetical protein PR003_g6972 [Phytophthora rubi]|uniref:Cyclin N-terminal domain-containing protein n=1 Tax=Phytophthora rubi TaxID=129364 RepID=A0A6A4FQU2_9STRA|nr:hypothetical protein PR002_g5538 [Phytophthora rubi]KAE9044276.1 hypothetical protein PR001_g5430 [Phytophthora rubi]KAE9347371.1 hypothetical protein PR003_g6972 [Phytophthora rubi]
MLAGDDAARPSRPPLLVPSPSSAAPSERSRHSRRVTRDIAALDFLQSIPMRSEADADAESEANAANSTADAASSAAPAASNGAPSTTAAVAAASSAADPEPLAGRRLPGMAATVVHVPPLFRYRFTTKFPAASAVVRRWEGVTAQQGLLDARLFFSRGCGYPLATSTIINYNGNETTARRRRFASLSGLALERPSPSHYDWRGTSYFRLLHATWSACDPDRDREDAHPERVPYSANFLDDPEFRQGRHRHVVRGDKSLGPIISSILLFVKPHELKDELNQKFQEKHAWWLQDPSLSLSKLRHLKREALMCSQRLDLEVATVALACVLFEKLVLQHYVTKVNRKLYMAVCFLLAVKFNEPCASDERKRVVRQLLEDIDRAHALPSRDVLTAEFTVYAQLSFNLHVPIAEVHPHFVRLLKLIESNPRKYLDDDVFTSYSALLAMEEQAENLGMVLSDPLDGFDEATDGEARLSDEEDETESGTDNDQRGRKRKNSGGGSKNTADDPSMFPWHNVSFTQWWRKRRNSRERHESPPTTPLAI